MQINKWSLRVAVAALVGFAGSSHAQQSQVVGVVQVEGEVRNYVDTGPQRASGSLLLGGFELRSSADLATGTLKAYAAGNRPGDGMATGSAGATFTDSLWFNGATVGTYVGELQIAFDATLTPDASYEATWNGISAMTNVAVSTASGNTQIRFAATDCSSIALSCREGGSVQEAFSMPLVIASTDLQGRGSVLFTASVQASAVGGGIADAGHTLRLSLALLPEYQTYSSASGAFLTAVPEPSTVVMLLGGLLGVGVLRKGGYTRQKQA